MILGSSDYPNPRYKISKFTKASRKKYRVLRTRKPWLALLKKDPKKFNWAYERGLLPRSFY